MISNRPKFLKAILFTNNISEVGAGVVQSQCFTVQDYHYHCFRSRDDQGNPFGSILSDYLDFSVVVSDLDACKFFYQAMEQNDSTPMSFLFNATVEAFCRIPDPDDKTKARLREVKSVCDRHFPEMMNYKGFTPAQKAKILLFRYFPSVYITVSGSGI